MKATIITGIILFMLAGCSRSIDFREENKVMFKHSSKYGTEYTLYNVSHLFDSFLWAPDGFANIGDIVTLKDGKITVLPQKRRNELKGSE